jgi:hypothetical protein
MTSAENCVDSAEREILLSCVARALETMFYTFIDAELDPAAGVSDGAVRVRFEGSRAGSLALSLDSEAGRALAGSFLGMEPDELSAAEVDHVTRELANILCGSFLSELEPGGHFSLSPPEPAPVSELARLESQRDLQIPEGKLTVWWSFQPADA